MIDALSLDQLRVFIAAAETGSFSAAGRKLRRAQSLVSQTVATLETQLDVKLFDRAKKYPQLTGEVGFFKETYPRTPLLLYVEALGAVVQYVLDGRCRIGVIGTLPLVPEN